MRIIAERKILVAQALSCITFSTLCFRFAFNTEVGFPRRALSIYHGDGTCTWTAAEPLDNATDPYGTLIASYPASGMRFIWQQVEGLTGIAVQDDFFALSRDALKFGIVKTQYPHVDGIWSFGDNMDQVILLVRDLRWAFPSYHTLLSEIHYAHTWEQAYQYEENVFTLRPPVSNWTCFRDYLFDQEVKRWKYHINYYMENGTQYWYDLDFERNGQFPFGYLNETEQAAKPKDPQCKRVAGDCTPSTIVSYERMYDASTGPGELKKIADTLRGKPLMTVPDDDDVACIWHKTILDAPEPRNEDRAGLPRTAYNFTLEQMYVINQTYYSMKDKYSNAPWIGNTNAEILVSIFDEYILSIADEIAVLEANPSPTPVPNPSYTAELVQWYKTLGAEEGQTYGKGDRYSKEKVQDMVGYWPLVKHLYPSEAPVMSP